MKTFNKRINFTNRQLTILQLWSELSTEADIARNLGISEHTVHTHLRRMREKTGLKRTFDVWKLVIKRGLLSFT